ncbi:hypothetical protein [Profundibacter sp.]|uniref:hypothetical protein n=1 Tax=Profundibacter sp. TaxID=3101071 RepID=UPI003D1017B6
MHPEITPSSNFHQTRDTTQAEITGGLPASWTGNPVSTMTSTNNWVYQMVFPKWREV